MLNNSLVKHHPLFTRQGSEARDEDMVMLRPLQLSTKVESATVSKVAPEIVDLNPN